MKKRVLSLLLCFVLAAGLLSVCAPPAQAGTIAGAFEDFIKQPDHTVFVALPPSSNIMLNITVKLRRWCGVYPRHRPTCEQ